MKINQNSPVLYYRFHGVPELYKSEYEKRKLEGFVREVQSEGITKQAFIYFNNDIGGSAIKNAREMLEILRS